MYDIYSRSKDDRLRFLLGRNGNKMLYVIGLNPSTATQEKSDTTVAKVEEVARLNGYSGFAMLNLYPVRATDYNKLSVTPEATAIAQNFTAIETLLGATQKPTIWVAWGQSVLARAYFLGSAKLLEARLRPLQPNWLHFGELTARGHPRHPSRLSYAWSFSKFNMPAYVSRIDA
jgi:hypothetical protein